MKEIHRKVLQMREREATYEEICEETGLAKSTVSYVISKYYPSNKNRAIYEKKQRASRGKASSFFSAGARKKARIKADEFYANQHRLAYESYLKTMRAFEDQSFIHYIAGLYEGEGCHGTKPDFDFYNSDLALILPFLRFLRDVLHLPEDRFTLRLALHASLPKEECVAYWERECGHKVNFVDQYDSRPQKKVHKHHKHRKFYGTITVRVKKPNGLKSALKEYTY